eukprot:CAMPEP_0168483464 /NCGR_PEP_ID=MMETSP0228-20121227/65584_1 /TAXON_ID=133427 /ORGANISM="Protoceratium reticulatum, Strain CCCM 535 (=CCMP 1889)" /LENGTH=57 /DNA_ID=CAMNT_0008499951 /DNA_START=58 /DNA_END=228 /DNA_ORIENTATION=-
MQLQEQCVHMGVQLAWHLWAVLTDFQLLLRNHRDKLLEAQVAGVAYLQSHHIGRVEL